ncbi:ImmA/IrrE family metallo-endopeptidase [Turicibacter sanguinis]|uniref:ImmA/IrrE family metallo-endopeptidase n=2 Tax=Turicibacter sanguinis TaxID=154288 RepID=UPI00232DC78D|nr:ImmA/IrrE family metallo-endopeptidase [Turicibacter sanguinis]MDB8575753.1 ImmA/IrrE family metallo-endopeptidase [Turicibacter sanguinis]MDB8578411.1 ImmA/IrrE family metallo-endopeptidase [Turicibacter sanguinis]MDB8584265.1 ImmA/IrrE family metallo-endopeptidase [Turicibacter sanguinis]MDB8587174.1 ImmA/IrrE family metallo-endopeptidase [Turicibacter sanguinis]MDB8598242.1 ImmA/IrrE family metallo-endopeptidase [Turicibacter sanguinis]
MRVNRLDNFISNIYKNLNIFQINELNIEQLGKAFKVPICYTDIGPAYIRQGSRCVILVDSTKESHLQKEEFYHELSHFILDHHLCNNKLLIDYFEAKADNLVPYLAIPLHMLKYCDLKSPFVVQELSQSFGVSYDLVFKRLEQIKLYSKEWLHEGFSS